jgi:hypothetical protein
LSSSTHNEDDDDPRTEDWYHQDELIRRYYEEFDMPKTSEMIQSKYLKKEDFPAPRVLTIKDCSLEEVGRNGETKWVLFFKEVAKGCVLNVTKIKKLESEYGDDSDGWTGKRVKVWNNPNVMFGMERVGGLDFIMPSEAKKPVEPPPEDFNDDVPF